MKINEITEIFDLISEANSNNETRSILTLARRNHIKDLINNEIKKVAFDTRRINEETQYNPRRGLQNYHRSEPFISEAIAQKLTSFGRLRKVVKSLENKFGREPEWGDSYARVLLSTLDKGLRVNEKDGDFSAEQPSVGSLDYIQQLLHLRYRLTSEDITRLSEDELRSRILGRDEELLYKQAYLGMSYEPQVVKTTEQKNEPASYVVAKNEPILVKTERQLDSEFMVARNDSYISRREVMTKDYDSLVDKLFGNVKASKENPEVERAVTITIKEKVAS